MKSRSKWPSCSGWILACSIRTSACNTCITSTFSNGTKDTTLTKVSGPQNLGHTDLVIFRCLRLPYDTSAIIAIRMNSQTISNFCLSINCSTKCLSYSFFDVLHSPKYCFYCKKWLLLCYIIYCEKEIKNRCLHSKWCKVDDIHCMLYGVNCSK